MSIVIDTSVIIAILTNEDSKPGLINQTAGMKLIAPHSMIWEIGNAFSAMFKRNRISLEQASHAINEYKKIPIQYYDVNLGDTLKIAYELKIYAYDAYFLVCAKNLNLPLLTLDLGLQANAEAIGIKYMEIVS